MEFECAETNIGYGNGEENLDLGILIPRAIDRSSAPIFVSEVDLLSPDKLNEVEEEKKEGEKVVEKPSSNVTLDDFYLRKVLGRGGYGKVFLIEKKDNPGEVYAMKSIDKLDVIEDEMLDSTIVEKNILLCASHPFLMKMHYVF